MRGVDAEDGLRPRSPIRSARRGAQWRCLLNLFRRSAVRSLIPLSHHSQPSWSLPLAEAREDAVRGALNDLVAAMPEAHRSLPHPCDRDAHCS